MKLKTEYLFLYFVTTLISFSFHAFGADFNPQLEIYQIEYSNVMKTGPTILTIIFNSKIEPQKAEEFTRDQINQAIKYQDPKTDIQAFAWYQLPNQSTEKMIEFSGGSSFLIYELKTKKILLSKDYEAALVGKPQSGNEIEVSFEVNTEKNESGEIRVLGRTNLPDNMDLMISLTNPSIKYFGQDKIKIKNNSFVSAWFNNKGTGLSPGKYKIEITSPLTDFQPNTVKEIIGERGENLLGDAVKMDYGQNLIDYTTTKSIN